MFELGTELNKNFLKDIALWGEKFIGTINEMPKMYSLLGLMGASQTLNSPQSSI
jgi:hypothetical protein